MAKLLFDESPLVVQPGLAKKIGLNEAIVLQQIHYWLQGNKSGKEIDGARWIYNSLADWQEQFPFWSESTIYRTLQSLEEKMLLKTGNYNQRRGDRTKWYTIAYDELHFLEMGGDRNSVFQDGTANLQNETPSCQNGTTLPETTHEISTQTTAVANAVSTATPENNDFQKIWQEVEQVFIVVNSSDFFKLRELWEKYPQIERHRYALERAKKANPRQLRFYLKDFASFDPTAPRTWGQELTPSPVPSGFIQEIAAVPIHPDALKGYAEQGETVEDTLNRLLKAGTIKEKMYNASRQRYSDKLNAQASTIRRAEFAP